MIDQTPPRRQSEKLFRSFFHGGFECSTHRTRTGRRLDVIAATAHDRFALLDYTRLAEQRIRTARDGLRWHLIERTPGEYDWSSVLPIVRAAQDTGTQVIWDLCHYGFPDWLDLFSPDFVARLAKLSRAFARLLADESDEVPIISPVNEISFFAWAAGDVAYIHPLAADRGDELKRHLIRATIEAIEAFWVVHPAARIVHTDPLINVVPHSECNHEVRRADAYRLAQYQAWDMLAGRLAPEVGGAEKYLDVLGVNFYPHNQWFADTPSFNPTFAIPREHEQYLPFRTMLCEVYERYRRPIFIAETGAEGDARVDWLAYVCDETRAAQDAGARIEGICLYPIVNHPGWDDDRHCHNGLWDYADDNGYRPIYELLADELARQQHLFARNERGVESDMPAARVA